MAEVSVLTATRNRSGYLQQLLESVAAQTYPDWEMVIVDNGSTDGTAALVHDYQAKFPGRLRYVPLPSNVGWSEGIARAAEASSGNFLLCIGDDDLLMPDALEREIAAFRESPELGLVYANMWVGEEPYRETYCSDEFRGPVKEPLSIERFLRTPRYPGLLIQTALLRKEVYRAVGGLNLQWGCFSDSDLLFQIATRFPITYLPTPLAFFRRHNANTTSLNLEEFLEEDCRYWTHVARRVRHKEDRRALGEYLRRRRISAAFHYFNRAGDVNYRRFRRHLFEASRCDRSVSLFLVCCLAFVVRKPAFQSVYSVFSPAWRRAFVAWAAR